MTGAVPLLVLVNGVPGSGKSSIARLLRARLGLPVIAKDPIKERLYMQAPPGERDGLAASRRLGVAAIHSTFRAARRELRAGRSLLLDAPLSRELDGARIEAWSASGLCVPFEVRVTAEPDVIVARRRRRAGTRHPAHHAQDVLQSRAEIERTLEWVLPRGPAFELDTSASDFSAEVNLDGLVAAIEAGTRPSV